MTVGATVLLTAALGGATSAFGDAIVAPPIAVGSDPQSVAFSPDGGKAYVTNSGDGTVSVIDATTDLVVGSPINVGSGPWGVAFSPDGSVAYVTNVSGTVTVIVSR